MPWNNDKVVKKKRENNLQFSVNRIYDEVSTFHTVCLLFECKLRRKPYKQQGASKIGGDEYNFV